MRTPKNASRFTWRPGDLELADGNDGQPAPFTPEDIRAERDKSTSDLAASCLDRAAAALTAGDRLIAAEELELASACSDDDIGARLCRMAISLARGNLS